MQDGVALRYLALCPAVLTGTDHAGEITGEAANGAIDDPLTFFSSGTEVQGEGMVASEPGGIVFYGVANFVNDVCRIGKGKFDSEGLVHELADWLSGKVVDSLKLSCTEPG